MTEETVMRIMLCYDGSNAAREGIRESIRLARAMDGKILVVTCASRVDKDYPRLIEPLRQGLEEVKRVVGDNKLPCETSLLFRADEDEDGEALVSYAKEKEVAYMVVGIRNRSKLGKLVFGSVAQFVILKAECPVIGVKHKANASYLVS